MLYSERFKRQVVKKALSSGMIQTDMCKKLGLSISTLHKWKKVYADEMRNEIEEVDIAALLIEDKVDIEELLKRAEHQELAAESGSQVIADHIDRIEQSGKNAGEYDQADKYAVVRAARHLEGTKRTVFLRKLGLCERHINQWEEELIKMSKHPITNDERVKTLEDENKRLKKQLAEAERDKHELEVLIELKKKYHRLFEPDEEAK
jgi:transposase-like protein